MDPELGEALERRRLISGDIAPTGALTADKESDTMDYNKSPLDNPLDLAVIQVQSLLIGATQSIGSQAVGGIEFFVKQIQDIIKQDVRVVERLRSEGVNIADRLVRQQEIVSSSVSSASSSSAAASAAPASVPGPSTDTTSKELFLDASTPVRSKAEADSKSMGKKTAIKAKAKSTAREAVSKSVTKLKAAGSACEKGNIEGVACEKR